MNYSEMPKLDLHCHLDGSINLTLAQELLRERGEEVTLPELRVRMQVPEHCTSLEEYLKTFALPLDLLQTEDSLRRGTDRLSGGAVCADVLQRGRAHGRTGYPRGV